MDRNASMELVTLAEVKLNRIGTADTFLQVPRQTAIEIREVRDQDPQTLREAVIEVAVEHGESRDGLASLRQETGYHHFQPAQKGALYFNVQGTNIQYSDVYAVCLSYPALKIGDRYFKLEEVMY
ncbi:hypothetical protein [Asaia lannensis]|uniref:hypothetical protein n=1 Tax=Asaia lannensis TaxID=415421 RepID=UPI001C994B1C